MRVNLFNFFHIENSILVLMSFFIGAGGNHSVIWAHIERDILYGDVEHGRAFVIVGFDVHFLYFVDLVDEVVSRGHFLVEFPDSFELAGWELVIFFSLAYLSPGVVNLGFGFFDFLPGLSDGLSILFENPLIFLLNSFVLGKVFFVGIHAGKEFHAYLLKTFHLTFWLFYHLL